MAGCGVTLNHLESYRYLSLDSLHHVSQGLGLQVAVLVSNQGVLVTAVTGETEEFTGGQKPFGLLK